MVLKIQFLRYNAYYHKYDISKEKELILKLSKVNSMQLEENGVALYSGIKRYSDNYYFPRKHQGGDPQVPSKFYIVRQLD